MFDGQEHEVSWNGTPSETSAVVDLDCTCAWRDGNLRLRDEALRLDSNKLEGSAVSESSIERLQ